jgi:outer membrane lipoprotein
MTQNKNILYLIITVILIFATLSGCAPVISKAALGKVDTVAPFFEISKGPVGFINKTVLLGGAILKVDNLEEATVVEVLETELNKRLKPSTPESSSGRFMIEFQGFMDPAVYATGRLITVVGMITGAHVGKIGGMDYVWPVITPVEHYLWRYGPVTKTGVGLSIGIGYRD